MANIINISVFMYITVLVLGAVSSFNLFGGPVTDFYNQTTTTTYTINGTTYDFLNPNAAVSGWNLGLTVATYAVVAIFGAIGLLLIVAGFYIAVAGIALSMSAYVYQLFNGLLPSVLTGLLTAVICLVYLIGLIQFVSGRSERLTR